MIIRVRRGLAANRTSYTPQAGELTFTTDTKKLYVGDGSTPGGLLVDLSGSGIVQTIIAGTNITVDSTDPSNPIVSAVGSNVISVNGATGEVVLDADDIDDTATTNKFVTAAEKAVLADTSGENTGDQDISGIATNAGAIASHVADTANPHSVTKTQVGLSAVPNTDFTSPVAANTAKVSYTDAAKVAGIENGADVTDTANVTAAGALMDSEVTNLADVKAFDPADYATAAQGAEADSAVQPGDLATVATTGAYSDLSGKPTVPTSVDDLNPSQTGNSGKFLKTDGSNATWEAIPGGGDMLAAVYDPNTVSGDAFDMDNMVEGTDTKIMTAAERSAIAANSAKVSYTDASKVAGIEIGADVTDATNVDAAGATMNTDTSLAGNGYFLDEDNMASNSASKAASQQSIKAYIDAAIIAAKAALFPVGSYYINETDSTNPATLLGFGTWTAVTDKFIVGHGSTYTSTGGSASHSHPLSDAGAAKIDMAAPANMYEDRVATASWNSEARASISRVSNTTAITNGAGLIGDTDSASSIPPYQAAYIWKRTA